MKKIFLKILNELKNFNLSFLNLNFLNHFKDGIQKIQNSLHKFKYLHSQDNIWISMKFIEIVFERLSVITPIIISHGIIFITR